jgi:hypothetical protein
VYFCVVVTSSSLCALFFAELVGVSLADPSTAAAVFPGGLFLFLCFAGFVVPLPQLPHWLRVRAPPHRRAACSSCLERNQPDLDHHHRPFITRVMTYQYRGADLRHLLLFVPWARPVWVWAPDASFARWGFQGLVLNEFRHNPRISYAALYGETLPPDPYSSFITSLGFQGYSKWFSVPILIGNLITLRLLTYLTLVFVNHAK